MGSTAWSLLGQNLTSSNTLQVRVQDAAGNDGPTFSTNYVLDTVAPATTGAMVAFSADTGPAAPISSPTPPLKPSPARSRPPWPWANLSGLAGQRCHLDQCYGRRRRSGWSLSGLTLTGSGTLQVRVADAAGNTSTPLSQTYVLDTTVPVFNPATSSPADNATGVSTGSALVLSFGERLGSADVTKIHLYDTAAQTTVDITATIDGSGRLVITPTAALKADTAYHLIWDADAILDVAGNAASALSDTTTFNFTTASGSPRQRSPQNRPTPQSLLNPQNRPSLQNRPSPLKPWMAPPSPLPCVPTPTASPPRPWSRP